MDLTATVTIKLTYLLILVSCIIFYNTVLAQKKWVGSSTGGWENVLNWQPVGVPAGTDDVILDNSFQPDSYKIVLPDILVSIHSLTIVPADAHYIELLIPVTNKNSPALIVSADGDALVIRRGGVLRNSSGLNSGQSIQVNGSVCIYNYGSYIHGSRSAHANDIVAKLSTRPETSRGVFEFDVPGGSYPISLSNRTFGTLILTAEASGGMQTYNASGSNPVTITGDLHINSGVQFNADLTKEIVVNGDYIQTGGVFNLASQSNNNVVKIKGNLKQAFGIITESSGGLPAIELSGTEHQLVSVGGSITNSVSVFIDNPRGISLVNPLTLPYKLVLSEGVLKTSAIHILTMLDSCSVVGGSSHSYIDGPLKKMVTADFEFPVGKQGNYAPLKITRTAGSGVDEVIAEYFLANPQEVYGRNIESPPMVRVSALEYWALARLGGSSSYKLTLSVGTYSHATALDKLVVARWNLASSTWISEGNDVYSGISTGTITSKVTGGFGAFTLASTVAIQNPLPLVAFTFTAMRNADHIELTWNVGDSATATHFEIEKSADGKEFELTGKVDRKDHVSRYEYRYAFFESGAIYFRLKLVDKIGGVVYSEIVQLAAFKKHSKIVSVFPVPVKNYTNICVTGKRGDVIELVILDSYGRIVKSFGRSLVEGINKISIDFTSLPPGLYAIQIFERKVPAGSVSIVKM